MFLIFDFYLIFILSLFIYLLFLFLCDYRCVVDVPDGIPVVELPNFLFIHLFIIIFYISFLFLISEFFFFFLSRFHYLFIYFFECV